ncbi:MAG: hypothetical protein MPW15_08245 [Candidatus Manganitrophus sp.]|nr:hypothetical protein [Candidatus Manganitrophus sp.]
MRTLSLGINGWSYADLYDPRRLKELAEMFYRSVEDSNTDLGRRYAAYRETQGRGISPVDESNLIVALAPHLDRFVSRLFQIERPLAAEAQRAEAEKPVFEFKRDFVIRRALKTYPSSGVAALDLQKLDRQMQALEGAIAPQVKEDRERAIAVAVVQLMEIERDLIRKAKGQQQVDAEPSRKRLIEICDRIRNDAARRPLLEERLPSPSALDAVPTAAEAATRLLDIAEQWVALHAYRADAKPRVKEWVTFRFPEKIDFMHLVETHPTREDLPESIRGPEERRRRRDGFALTDPRFNLRQVFNEVHYCIFCHDREKDSCSKGFIEKDGKIRENPLGIPLTGCPLDEKISEMHLVKRDGVTIGALATVMIDNPMLPGTGHRICNDCMKGCIYQKQEPVNIPQIETRMLTDVLDLPWGFEIYNLLTRWNPLNVKRPYPLPYNGKNVLVVGMGPAGYTLAHYLLNEGFGVVGIDGLKIEPLPAEWVGRWARILPSRFEQISEIYEATRRADHGRFRRRRRVRHHGPLGQELSQDDLPLSCPERSHFRVYGGVRFGGTLTIEDAWEFGFDHIAIATGAGRPTIVRHEEQPHPRHPQGERFPDGPAAHGRGQEEHAGEPAGAAAGRRDRRRPDGDRHRDRAVGVLSAAGREGSGSLRDALQGVRRRRESGRCTTRRNKRSSTSSSPRPRPAGENGHGPPRRAKHPTSPPWFDPGAGSRFSIGKRCPIPRRIA